MEDKSDDRGRRLNWRQACAILGCKRTHFYKLVEKKLLPSFRLAGARRGLWVYEDDVRKLVVQNGVKTP